MSSYLGPTWQKEKEPTSSDMYAHTPYTNKINVIYKLKSKTMTTDNILGLRSFLHAPDISEAVLPEKHIIFCKE